MEVINAMYSELKPHKIGTSARHGVKTADTENRWLEYRSKYGKLSEESIIKLRFKRRTDGQLRIQAAISSKNFYRYLLENPHIRII